MHAGRFDNYPGIRSTGSDLAQCDGPPGRRRPQLTLRLHLFHLLQSFLAYDRIGRGQPARGWHGEAYRGHIFWDELYIFPVLNLRFPALTKALLFYRHRRLEQARRNARNAGFSGALYPWQSGSNGREESQILHLNPKSGRWIPDNSLLQRHVNAAIAYNVWQYAEATDDWEFLSTQGAEMFLEIARFWVSTASYNSDKERYEILRVMGPDEYHDEYPDAETPGLNNNAYTNLMVVWILCRALELLDRLRRRAGPRCGTACTSAPPRPPCGTTSAGRCSFRFTTRGY